MNCKYLFLFNKIILAGMLALATGSAVQAQQPARPTLCAAVSVKDALDDFLKSRAARGHGAVNVVYAATSALARQIESGMPADVFISADTDWMDYLAQRKLLRKGTRANLLTNRLVLITPATAKLKLAIGPKFPLAAALGKDRMAMADPDSVPAGKYAKAALTALGVWHEVAPKAARTDNVRAALRLVALGETPLGIVYASDAAAEPRVSVQGEFPAHSHAPIRYVAAILAGSRSTEAKALLADLRSAEAGAIWRKHGFGVAE